MDSQKLLNWIVETFGELKPGSLIQLTERVSEKEASSRATPTERPSFSRIAETEFTYQVVDFAQASDIEKNMPRWRESFNARFGDAARKFQAEHSDIYIGSQVDTKKRVSFLLVISLFRKEGVG
jgi:hypothetical protein